MDLGPGDVEVDPGVMDKSQQPLVLLRAPRLHLLDGHVLGHKPSEGFV